LPETDVDVDLVIQWQQEDKDMLQNEERRQQMQFFHTLPGEMSEQVSFLVQPLSGSPLVLCL